MEEVTYRFSSVWFQGFSVGKKRKSNVQHRTGFLKKLQTCDMKMLITSLIAISQINCTHFYNII